MTAPEGPALALRLALLLHPRGYRRDRQQEIATVFTEVTAGAGRFAVAREVVDLAGHGLRMRMGLTSSGIPGRLAAAAVPYAVGAAAGWPLLNLYLWLRAASHGQSRFWRVTGGDWSQLTVSVLALLLLLAVLRGRWTAARTLGALVVLGGVLSQWSWFAQQPLGHGGWRAFAYLLLSVVWGPGTSLLWTVLSLAAPPDLLAPATRRSRVAALGSLLAMAAFLHENSSPFGLAEEFGHHLLRSEDSLALAVVCEVLALLLALPALLRGRLLPAVLALVGLPPTIVCFAGMLHLLLPGDTALVVLLTVVGVPALAVTVAHLWHPTVPERTGRTERTGRSRRSSVE